MKSNTKNINAAIALPVMEHFYTIQGEGVFQGKAAYFVRIAGCDVGCTWCDVKESWDAGAHSEMTLDNIYEVVKQSKAKLVVVTGGEPLMYNLDDLCVKLRTLDVRLHIETSGAYPLSGDWDWICLSPKRFKKPLAECLAAANELKVIVAHKNDFRFAEKFKTSIPKDCTLLLQPEWDSSEALLPEIIAFVKENPTYRITLQTHKFMQVP